ncbi:hypothetical protein quinque_003639 [Culex quinquefasciatus]
MSPPRGMKVVQAITLVLILAALLAVPAKKAPRSTSGHNLERSLDDELKTDKKLIERCIRELYILSKSCPQPSMVEAAKEMLYHKGPPPPPPQPAAPAGPTSRFQSASRNRPSSPVDAISGLPVVGAPTKKLKGGKKKRKDPFDL